MIYKILLEHYSVNVMNYQLFIIKMPRKHSLRSINFLFIQINILKYYKLQHRIFSVFHLHVSLLIQSGS